MNLSWWGVIGGENFLPPQNTFSPYVYLVQPMGARSASPDDIEEVVAIIWTDTRTQHSLKVTIARLL